MSDSNKKQKMVCAQYGRLSIKTARTLRLPSSSLKLHFSSLSHKLMTVFAIVLVQLMTGRHASAQRRNMLPEKMQQEKVVSCRRKNGGGPVLSDGVCACVFVCVCGE